MILIRQVCWGVVGYAGGRGGTRCAAGSVGSRLREPVSRGYTDSDEATFQRGECGGRLRIGYVEGGCGSRQGRRR